MGTMQTKTLTSFCARAGINYRRVYPQKRGLKLYDVRAEGTKDLNLICGLLQRAWPDAMVWSLRSPGGGVVSIIVNGEDKEPEEVPTQPVVKQSVLQPLSIHGFSVDFLINIRVGDMAAKVALNKLARQTSVLRGMRKICENNGKDRTIYKFSVFGSWITICDIKSKLESIQCLELEE